MVMAAFVACNDGNVLSTWYLVYNQYNFLVSQCYGIIQNNYLHLICQNIFQESPNHGWFYCSHIMKPPRTFVKELLQQLRNLPLLTFRPRPPKPPGCCWMSNWKSSLRWVNFRWLFFVSFFFIPIGSMFIYLHLVVFEGKCSRYIL